MPKERGGGEAEPGDAAELVALRGEVERLRRLVGPAAGGAIVGRDREIAELEASLRGKGGATTIVGPPGVGKSALARALVERRPSRGVICPVGGARDQAMVSAAVAESLSLAPGPIDEQIGVALRARGSFLLVLDNFEPASWPLDGLTEWLRAAPRTRLLVTSRRALGLVTERVFELGGLGLPASDDDIDCASAHFFLARAQAAGSRLARTPETRRAIVAIVRGLDGIPHALELAAIRITHETLARVAATVVASPLVDAGSSCIDRALEASWALLGPEERSALGTAALFRGGFDLEAAAYVLDRSPSAALGVLQRLQEHSLLAPERQPEGGTRYRLSETIRRFVSDKPESRAADAGVAEQRHADYYLRQLDRRLRAREVANLAAIQDRAMERRDASVAPRAALEIAAAGDAAGFLRDVPALLAWAEVPNEVAFELALAAAKCADRMQRPGAAVELLGHARRLGETMGGDAPLRCDLIDARVCLHHGELREVRAALSSARARDAASIDLVIEADVLDASADLFEGCLGRAEAGFERALRIARERNLPGIEARSLNGLTAAHHLQGAFTESLEDARAAAAAAARTGDPVAEGRARSDAGLLAAEHGDLATARTELERAQQQLERHGDLRHAATAAQNLAAVYRELGEFERASRAALAAQRAGGRRLVGFALAERAYIAHEQGDIRRARTFYERALEAHRSAGNHYFAARMLPFRAAALLDLDEAELAEAAFVEAERSFAELDDRMGAAIAATLRGLLSPAARLGSTPRVNGTSPELRLARRLLERASERATATGAAVRVAADGAWFERGIARTSLRTRHALKLLLARLLLAHPGGALLSVEELFRAGWPGERAGSRSAARRVYVAIATLRKLGLRENIERHSEGYRLVGEVSVEASPAGI